MGRAPDFIGIGAQRAGTSWIYACLYEHPDICIPVKEIHFFSRKKNWSKGYEWYESIFNKCHQNTKVGEFSTSYLSDLDTPERIYYRYPTVKLIACLRNPLNRAYSNYMNDIKAGTIKSIIPFGEALQNHPEYIEQGRYATHLKRYLSFFSTDQILVMIYEDCLNDPLKFIQKIYRFIGVDFSFIPTMLSTRINVSRVPRFVYLDYIIMKVSEFLRNKGFHNIWWPIKKIGWANKIRALNTKRTKKKQNINQYEKEVLYKEYEKEIEDLEKIIGRKLKEWRL